MTSPDYDVIVLGGGAAAGVPFGAAMARVRATAAAIAAGEDESVLRGQGIDVLRGRARLTGAGTVDAVLGGGAVGCELAQAFARLGVTVHTGTQVRAGDGPAGGGAVLHRGFSATSSAYPMSPSATARLAGAV